MRSRPTRPRAGVARRSGRSFVSRAGRVPVNAADHFDHDVFISYAHIDDAALAEGEQGWVTRFHEALAARLSMVKGERVEIYRDPKLQGNDEFGDELLERLAHAAVLVSVFTPRYARSEWCLRELEKFCEAAERDGGTSLANKSRIFKVVKSAVDLERQPERMQRMVGYEFGASDPQTGRWREYPQDTRPTGDLRYLNKVFDLADDMADLLERLGERAGGGTGESELSGTTVYLASTSAELAEEHDAIRRRLLQRGHRVLPERALPTVASALEDAVREDLERSEVSVHLLGGHYGLVPEGTQRSILEIQNAVAVEVARGGALRRFIWTPPSLESVEPRQRDFLDRVRDDPETQLAADVLCTDLGELEAAILESIAPRPSETGATEAGDTGLVYVAYGPEDADAALPLEDALFDAGYEVMSPLLDSPADAQRADHRENLARCDALLILWGATDGHWLRGVLHDVEEAEAVRERPIPLKAVYVGPPSNRDKQRFRTRAATVLKNDDAFSTETLAPLLAQLAGEHAEP